MSGQKMDAGNGSGSADAPGMTIDAPPQIGVTAFSAGNITSVTLAKGAYTKIPYTMVEYDDQSEYDVSMSTYTAKFAGDYLVCASLLTNSLSSNVQLYIFKNGNREMAIGTGYGPAGGCTTIRLVVGDKIDIEAAHNNANSDYTAAPDPNWQWLTIHRITSTMLATASGTGTCASGQSCKILYNTKAYDDASQFDVGTNSFIAGTAGDYFLCAGLDWGALVDGELNLYLNNVARSGFAGGGYGYLSGCRGLRLAANDKLDVEGYQNFGVTQTMPIDTVWNYMTVQKQPMQLMVQGINSMPVTGGSFTRVLYSTEIFDDLGQFDPSSNTFTPAASGDYLICASLLTGTSFGNRDEIDIYRNGSREKALRFGNFSFGNCRVERLTQNETIQVWVLPSVSGTITSNTDWDYLTVSKLQ